MALIELEDTSWFPNVLRDQQLGYIGWLVRIIDIYQPIIHLLPNWITESGIRTVQDLCSGSGEPMLTISEKFPSQINVILSDKFPPAKTETNLPLNYLSSSIDVLHLSFESKTYYTMFNAFHHFSDTNKSNIITQLSTNKSSFCFIEILEPNALTMLKVVLANTFGQIFLAPFVRPFSLKRLLFTYLIPINILTTTYDGIISVLKSKNKTQYQTLLSEITTHNYSVEVQSHRAPFLNRLLVIRGFPLDETNI